MVITSVDSGNMPVNETHQFFTAAPGARRIFVESMSTSDLVSLYSVVIHKRLTARRAGNKAAWQRWCTLDEELLDVLMSRQMDIYEIEKLWQGQPIAADAAVGPGQDGIGADRQRRTVGGG